MAVKGNRNAVVTADNHGPLVAIATWFLMVSLIMAVLIRVAIRLGITRAPGREDATIVGAMVMPTTSSETIRTRILLTRVCMQLLGVGQSIAVSMAVSHGLGERGRNLSSVQLANVGKVRKKLYIVQHTHQSSSA